MRLVTLASGSTGNCAFVSSGRYNLLIDAGISMRNIEAGLAELELSPNDLDSILITHEHADHVKSVGPLLRKYRLKLYTAAGTAGELLSSSCIGNVEEELINYITPGIRFLIGDLSILPIPVSHDAAEPVMFRFDTAGSSAAILTDTGIITNEIFKSLGDLDLIFLEANHDIRMLQAGPYPYSLKQRILNDHGHLSNETAGLFLAKLNCERLRYVLLSHISKTNNYDKLALESVKLELLTNCTEFDAPEIYTAPENRLSKVFDI